MLLIFLSGNLLEAHTLRIQKRSPISNKEAAFAKKKAPIAPAAVPLEAKSFANWPKEQSSLGSRRISPSTWNAQDRPVKAEPEVRPKQMIHLPGNPRQPRQSASPPPRFERSIDKRPFANKPVVRLQPQRERIENALKTLSMQDINRYQFRRHHSSEPGLPVDKAGQP